MLPVVVSFESYNTLENSIANESTKIFLKNKLKVFFANPRLVYNGNMEKSIFC